MAGSKGRPKLSMSERRAREKRRRAIRRKKSNLSYRKGQQNQKTKEGNLLKSTQGTEEDPHHEFPSNVFSPMHMLTTLETAPNNEIGMVAEKIMTGRLDSSDQIPVGPPTSSQPTGSQSTDSQPTGSQPTGSQPTGSQPTGSQPTEKNASRSDEQETNARMNATTVTAVHTIPSGVPVTYNGNGISPPYNTHYPSTIPPHPHVYNTSAPFIPVIQWPMGTIPAPNPVFHLGTNWGYTPRADNLHHFPLWQTQEWPGSIPLSNRNLRQQKIETRDFNPSLNTNFLQGTRTMFPPDNTNVIAPLSTPTTQLHQSQKKPMLPNPYERATPSNQFELKASIDSPSATTTTTTTTTTTECDGFIIEEISENGK